MRLRQLTYAAILLCAVAVSACGQEARRAISRPTPRYPEIAHQLRLVGTVKVEVIIGADGKVKSTTVVGGHPILVNAICAKRVEIRTGENGVSDDADF